MLTDAQQHATDRFAKSLLALSDDALIDTYQQALDDHRAARAEGSDNLTKAYAQTLATENAMRDRFLDCQVDGMYSPELLRIEAAECRRGAIGKSARVERTLLALAERLESEATILEARESPDRPWRGAMIRNLPKS